MSDGTNTYKPDGSPDDLISSDTLTTLNGASVLDGQKAQRVKVGFGPDAELRDVDVDHPLPVVDSDVATTLLAVKTLIDALNAKVTSVNTGAISGTVDIGASSLPTGAATQATLAAIESKLPALINSGLRLAGYDPGDDMVKVKSVQKKWRDSFVGSSLNAAKWDSSIGTGGSITVSGGQLLIGSGTTLNAETYVLSKEIFTIPFRVNIGLTLSQRIANQTFMVEAVSVDAVTGIPDGLHCVALLFDGTTATQAKYRVQNSGATPLDSSASTFPTTASGGFYELEPFADESWFHGGTLDSTSGRANSYRRHQQIPEPNAVFKVRLRWLNSSSSVPASNTNAVIQYITVQDYAELTAEITAGRGQTVAGQAVGVSVVNAPTVSISGNPALGASTSRIGFVAGSGIWWDDSNTALGASASFTGTSRDLTVATSNVSFANAATFAKEFRVAAESDVAGTLYLEVSRDGSTFRRAKSVALAAISGGGYYAEIIHQPSWRFVRIGFTNGAAAQARFAIGSMALAA